MFFLETSMIKCVHILSAAFFIRKYSYVQMAAAALLLAAVNTHTHTHTLSRIYFNG